MVGRGAFLAALIFSAATAEAAPLYTLPAVQVTAARTEENAAKTPQAVGVIGRQEIETLGAVSAKDALVLADSLDLSEAVHTSTSPVAGNAVMIRGMNTNHTLILVDGMRMADEDTSQTRNVYLLSRIPAADIERIEILRGAGSALYGSDALGGVVNIITKTPGVRSGVWRAWTGTDSMGQSVSAATGRVGRWDMAVTGSWEKPRPIAHPQLYTESYAGGRVEVVTEGNDYPEFGHRASWRADGTYHFENTNDNQFRITAGGMAESLKTVYADSRGMGMTLSRNQREMADRERYDASMAYTGKTERNAYFFRAYWSRLSKWSEMRNDRNPFPSVAPPFLSEMYPAYDHDEAKYNLYGLEGRDTVTTGAHTVTYGGELLRTVYKGTRLSGEKIPAAYAMESWAAYVSDQWNVGKKLYLTPSIRIERNTRSGNAVIPKVGATYSWNASTRFKAEYGGGYRAPSVSELFLHMRRATPIGMIAVTGNPDLAPEKSRSWSTSFEKEWGQNFGKLTYFQNEVKNLITAAERVPHSNQYRYENIGRARIWGVEMELGRHLSDRLTVKAAGTLLHAENKATGGALDGRADARWQFQLRYDDGGPYGWSGILWDTLSSGYHFRERNYTWNTVHVSAEKRWGDFAFTFGVDNLLGRKDNDMYLTGRSWHGEIQLRM